MDREDNALDRAWQRADQAYDRWKDEHPPNCKNAGHDERHWQGRECLFCEAIDVFEAIRTVTP